MFMGTEFVTAVNQCNLLGDGLDHERPVYRGVAAAADENLLAFEAAEVVDEIMKVGLFVCFCPFNLQSTGLERSYTGCNDNSFGVVFTQIRFTTK